MTVSQAIRKNIKDRKTVFEKVSKWEAREAAKRKIRDEENLRIAARNNANPFLEMFLTTKKFLLCQRKSLTKKEKADLKNQKDNEHT